MTFLKIQALIQRAFPYSIPDQKLPSILDAFEFFKYLDSLEDSEFIDGKPWSLRNTYAVLCSYTNVDLFTNYLNYKGITIWQLYRVPSVELYNLQLKIKTLIWRTLQLKVEEYVIPSSYFKWWDSQLNSSLVVEGDELTYETIRYYLKTQLEPRLEQPVSRISEDNLYLIQRKLSSYALKHL